MRATRPSAPPPAVFRPRRRFGQNFLVNREAVRRIVAAAAPRPGEAVVEIGPGDAALTSPLAASAGHIAAVELDRDLAAGLRARFPAERLTLVEADILCVSFLDVLEALRAPRGERLLVVGNLPYNISKPVAMKLVVERKQVSRAVLMFQKEVADRLTASPGTRAYGPMTILCGFAYAIESLFDLGPASFRPRPKVVSTVTRWVPRSDDEAPRSGEAALRACLAAAFAHRRRTLLANLRAAFGGDEGAARRVLDSAGIDGAARAEALPAEAFRRLAHAWPGAAVPS